jgi:hypothetical protein
MGYCNTFADTDKRQTARFFASAPLLYPLEGRGLRHSFQSRSKYQIFNPFSNEAPIIRLASGPSKVGIVIVEGVGENIANKVLIVPGRSLSQLIPSAKFLCWLFALPDNFYLCYCI